MTVSRDKLKRILNKYGVSGIDKPKRTPNHPKKSHIVVTKVDGEPKVLRFGEQGADTNNTVKQRTSFKARHAKNIAKGKSSPAYWADKVKWNPKKTKSET